MGMLEQRKIDPLLMVTHRLNGLEEIPEAYDQLFNKTGGCVKVLVSLSSTKHDRSGQQQAQEKSFELP